MKNKTQLICTISMLLGAIVVIAINFTAFWSGSPVSNVNITATFFYFVFWLLMVRFKPAAKISLLLSLYTLAASILSFCDIHAEWTGIAHLVTVFVSVPSGALFYGIRFFQNLKFFSIITAIRSFVIIILSLITMVNKTNKVEKNVQST